jgi:hypothetical protein
MRGVAVTKGSSTPNARRRRRAPSPGAKGWHSASWWAGVGGVATVLAAVLALLAWWFPRSAGAPPTSAAASSAPRGPLPLTLLSSASTDDCGGPGRFYLPHSVGDVPGDIPEVPGPTADEAEFDAYAENLSSWTAANGGFTRTNWIEFSVEGNSSRASILTALRVNIVSRSPLTSKTIITIEECGGLAPPRPFEADFTAHPPRVRSLPGETEDADGNVIGTPPANFPFTVSDSDPEIFTLAVGPGPACDCAWTANIDYTQDGKSYTAPIDDHGQPFHAVPTDDLPAYRPMSGRNQDSDLYPNCRPVHDEAERRWTSLCPQ